MTLTVAVSEPLAAGLRLSLAPLDYTLLFIYFIFVIGIGFALRRLVQTSTDFFLSGRSLPSWITGIAFISANLGAIEILGMAASGAQYGISVVHYYWIGAVPAMVFLGVVMMPFYYGSRVRSVPEYLLRRFDRKTHLVNAIIFVAGLGADRRGEPVRARRRAAGRCSASRWPSPSSPRRCSCCPTSCWAGCPAPSTTR